MAPWSFAVAYVTERTIASATTTLYVPGY
jgi:hypothetical protein